MYVQNLVAALDEVVKGTVKHYKEDWTEIDRKTAVELILEGEPFVFIPRECGCYLVHRHQSKSMQEALFNYYQSNGTEVEGARYFAVAPYGYADSKPANNLFEGSIYRGVECAKKVFEHIKNEKED